MKACQSAQASRSSWSAIFPVAEADAAIRTPNHLRKARIAAAEAQDRACAFQLLHHRLAAVYQLQTQRRHQLDGWIGRLDPVGVDLQSAAEIRGALPQRALVAARYPDIV